MEQENAKREKTAYITLLSVVSTIAVVCLHTNGCFWTFSTKPYWFTANILESLFYFSVPAFFMISGATLMDYRDRYSTGAYLAKRIKKTVVPFLAWSLIGLLYNVAFHGVQPSDITLKYVVNGILGTTIIQKYWFFIPLFCIYLCIPLFAAVPRESRRETFSYIAVLFFVISVLIPFLRNVFSISMTWPFSLAVGHRHMMYAVIGYLLYRYDLTKRQKTAVYILAAAGLLMHICGTYQLSMAAGAVDRTYKGFDNLPSMLYAVGIFVFFKDHGDRLMRTALGRPVRFLAGYTFGIYLTHHYIMEGVKYCFARFLHISGYSLKYRLGAPLVIVLLAVALVYVMRKIPVLRRIVP